MQREDVMGWDGRVDGNKREENRRAWELHWEGSKEK